MFNKGEFDELKLDVVEVLEFMTKKVSIATVDKTSSDIDNLYGESKFKKETIIEIDALVNSKPYDKQLTRFGVDNDSEIQVVIAKATIDSMNLYVDENESRVIYEGEYYRIRKMFKDGEFPVQEGYKDYLMLVLVCDKDSQDKREVMDIESINF